MKFLHSISSIYKSSEELLGNTSCLELKQKQNTIFLVHHFYSLCWPTLLSIQTQDEFHLTTFSSRRWHASYDKLFVRFQWKLFASKVIAHYHVSFTRSYIFSSWGTILPIELIAEIALLWQSIGRYVMERLFTLETSFAR